MKKIIYLLLLNLAVTNSILAQNKVYEVNEHTSWTKFYLQNVSKDNRWVNYNNSILFVENLTSIRNIDSKVSFDFKNSHAEKFSENSKWFSLQTNESTLLWLNLNSHRRDSLANVKSSAFTKDSNFLIAHTLNNALHFINLHTNKKDSPGRVSMYDIQPVNDGVAVVLTSEKGDVLKIYELKNNSQQEVLNLPGVKIKKIAWNKNGDKLAFLYQEEQSKFINLGVFDYNANSTRFLMEKAPTTKTGLMEIANAEISMDDAGNRVFFQIKGTHKPSNTSVEVWDTADPVILSRRKMNNPDNDTSLLHVWNLGSGEILPMETEEFSKALWGPNSPYAIIYNPIKYEPQFHHREFGDIYALNLNTGVKQKIMDKQYTHGTYLKLSPQGNFLAYFRENNWWVYDMQLNKHTNLTADIPVRWDDEFLTNYSFPNPYGLYAWSGDDKEVYIYDAYDLWKLSVDGKQKQKLTNGRKDKIRHRIHTAPNHQKVQANEFMMRIPIFQPKEDIFIRTENRDNFSTGFYKLMSDGSLHEIAIKEKKLSNLFPLDKHRYIFQEESMEIPPSITLVNKKNKQEQTIVQSNEGWQNFTWPEKKLIRYSTPFAKDLKGILIYPVNYHPEKKYPMLVNVYEDFSIFFHSYLPPAFSNEIGFNYINYALDDYFVLLPDIVYLKNKTGSSATQCTMSAIDKVLEIEKSVNENKLGLIGHSFGGYETAFLITQTDRFKAAVAGNGIFNLYSKYLELQHLTGLPEYVRIEKGQFRMKDGFFENKEAYIENTPIHHFDKVNTPLLIWAGKEDSNVNPAQSMQGYLALRRLQKPAVMYLYENEGHFIMDKDNQVHLTNQIKKWFDTHLK